MNVTTVVIVTKPHQPDVAKVASQLAAWFEGKGIRASMDPASAVRADLCVVVGGDGTLLAAGIQQAQRHLRLAAAHSDRPYRHRDGREHHALRERLDAPGHLHGQGVAGHVVAAGAAGGAGA